jgi:hypothetical protein
MLIEAAEFLDRMKGTIPEQITAADLETLNEGLRFFFSKLRLASGLFRQSEDDQRHAAIVALDAAWRLVALFKQRYSENLFLPLLRLQDALRKLDEGTVAPMLKPVRRGGRTMSTDARAALRGHAAGTVERLVEAGLPLEVARTRVAEALKELDVRPERGSSAITARTVRGWCEEVAADVGRHGAAAIVYDGMFTDDERRRFSGLPSDQRRRALALSSLAGFVRAHFPSTTSAVSSGPKKPLNPPFSRRRTVASSTHVHIVPKRSKCRTRASSISRFRIAQHSRSLKLAV